MIRLIIVIVIAVALVGFLIPSAYASLGHAMDRLMDCGVGKSFYDSEGNYNETLANEVDKCTDAVMNKSR